MSRTLVDVDDEALAAAARELGTTTKVATINAALRLAAGTSERVAGFRRLGAALNDSDLGESGLAEDAWR